MSSEIEVARVGITVTLQVAERFEPSVVVAVITVCPVLTAKIVAVLSSFTLTTATSKLSDFHVTDLFEASSGNTIQLIF